MTHAVYEILVMATPLLFATLGALVSEYAGVLAVFMDGAITLAGFICIAVTQATGNPAVGYLCATVGTIALLYLTARFTEATGSNPFITGLALNLLASGLTSWLSVLLFQTRGTVSLQESAKAILPHGTIAATALLMAILLAFALRYTHFGLQLRVTGSSPEALGARGISASRFRVASWSIAAFFASAAGCELSLSLNAWVPNLSAGRGWTALAAVYLGYKKPILCAGAVILFAAAEYSANILQGTGHIPTTLVLGLPYLLALVAFVFIPQKKA